MFVVVLVSSPIGVAALAPRRRALNPPDGVAVRAPRRAPGRTEPAHASGARPGWHGRAPERTPAQRLSPPATDPVGGVAARAIGRAPRRQTPSPPRSGTSSARQPAGAEGAPQPPPAPDARAGKRRRRGQPSGSGLVADREVTIKPVLSVRTDPGTNTLIIDLNICPPFGLCAQRWRI